LSESLRGFHDSTVFSDIRFLSVKSRFRLNDVTEKIAEEREAEEGLFIERAPGE